MADENQDTDGETKNVSAAEPAKVKEKLLEKAFGPAAEAFGKQIRPVGKDAGEIVVVTVKTAKMLLAPARAVVWGAERIEDWLSRDVDEKLRRVPAERRIEPSLALAGPTVEAMRFVGDTPELREMFGNLLANAMDADTARNAHPAFVEIIKQLSPDEARILRFLRPTPAANAQMLRPNVPMLEVRSTKEGEKGWQLIMRHFSHIGELANCRHVDLVSSYVDNLCRLEICRVPENQYMVGDAVYQSLENDSRIEILKTQEETKGRQLKLERRLLTVTDFGMQFIAACVVAKA